MFDFLADYLFTKEEQPTMANFNARLEMLNALKNHWWKRRKIEKVAVPYVINASLEKISKNENNTIYVLTSKPIIAGESFDFSKASSYVISPGNKKTVDSTDFIATVYPNPTEYYVPNNSFQLYNNNIYFVPFDQSGTMTQYGIKEDSVISETAEYVQSSDRSAYPDSGEQDGYEYQYLGVPFENAVGAPKIETGSYVGTGTYGESNQNTLTFEFEPKLVIVYSLNSFLPKDGYWINGFIYGSGMTQIKISSASSVVYPSTSENTLSWYSENSAASQVNTNGTIYNYIAIG